MPLTSGQQLFSTTLQSLLTAGTQIYAIEKGVNLETGFTESQEGALITTDGAVAQKGMYTERLVTIALIVGGVIVAVMALKG